MLDSVFIKTTFVLEQTDNLANTTKEKVINFGGRIRMKLIHMSIILTGTIFALLPQSGT